MQKNFSPGIKFEEFTLSNGLRVILSNKPGIPNVTVNTAFHIGSKDEEEGKSGLAHLFEHLMFVESPNVPKGMFDKILNMNGGDSNAFTTWDYTNYHITLPSNKLELALWLDSDRISGFNISEESLNVQKNVVMEENLQVHENVPYGSLEKESSKRLFDFNGYKIPIIGLMDDLKNTTLEDVNQFFQKYYSPDNAVLSIVGDIDIDKTAYQVENYYSDIPAGKKIERKLFQDKKIKEEIKDIIYDDIELPALFIYYKIPEYATKEYYALKIFNTILSEGESSKFYKELVYKKQLVSEIDSYCFGMEKAGVFSISAFAIQNISLDIIESEIDNILNDLSNNVIPDDEIIKTKNILATSIASRNQYMHYIAERISFYKIFLNDASKINSEINNYLSITKEEITEIVRKYIIKNNRVVLYYLPKENISKGLQDE